MKTNFNIFLILLTTTLAACINDYPSCDDCLLYETRGIVLSLKTVEPGGEQQPDASVNSLMVFFYNDSLDNNIYPPTFVPRVSGKKTAVRIMADTLQNNIVKIVVVANPDARVINHRGNFEELKKITLDASGKADKGHFYMSSSMYKKSGESQPILPILSPENIYLSFKEAQKEANSTTTDDKCIEVWLERMVAKVTLDTNDVVYDLACTGKFDEDNNLTQGSNTLIVDFEEKKIELEILGAFIANEPKYTYCLKGVKAVNDICFAPDEHYTKWATHCYNDEYKEVKVEQVEEEQVKDGCCELYCNEITTNTKDNRVPYVCIATQFKMDDNPVTLIKSADGFYFTEEGYKKYKEQHQEEVEIEQIWDNGRGYYAIPAIHKIKLGDKVEKKCGLVRNYHYKYAVKYIRGLGSSKIDNPEKPDNGSVIGFTYKLLDWKNVEVDSEIEGSEDVVLNIERSDEWTNIIEEEVDFNDDAEDAIKVQQGVKWQDGTYIAKNDEKCELLLRRGNTLGARCSFRINGPKGLKWYASLRTLSGKCGTIKFIKNGREYNTLSGNLNETSSLTVAWVEDTDEECMACMDFVVRHDGRTYQISVTNDNQSKPWVLCTNIKL